MATHNNNYADWTKLFGDFKAPTLDATQVINQLRRRAETGSTVLEIWKEFAQAAGRHNAAYAKQAVEASKGLFNQSSPEHAASKQADLAKSWMEYNRELATLAAKSAQEAAEVIAKDISDQLRQLSDATGTHTAPRKKAA